MSKIYLFLIGVMILMDECCLSFQRKGVLKRLRKTIRKEYKCRGMGSKHRR